MGAQEPGGPEHGGMKGELLSGVSGVPGPRGAGERAVLENNSGQHSSCIYI